MSNTLYNRYGKVERYEPVIKEYRKIDNISDTTVVRHILENKQKEYENELYSAKLEEDERLEHYNRLNKNIVSRYIKESQMPINIGRIKDTAKDAVFKDIVFEVFYKSLLLDKPFLFEHRHDLKYLTDKYIDDNGGYKLLENTIYKTNNEFLKRVKTVCENVSNKISDRKIKDSKEIKDTNMIDFDMNEEEKEELDYSKSDNLNLDKISDLVKNKVLTVVKDEKQRQEDAAELTDDIENDLKEDESVVDDDSLNEALNRIVISKTPYNQGTLFNSLMQTSYKEILNENVVMNSAHKATIDKDKKMMRNYDIDMDEEEALDNQEDVEDTEIDMDMVMAEAITKYTLMETIYTLGFENYTSHDIFRLTNKILNEASSKKDTSDNDFMNNRKEFFFHFNKLKDDPDSDKKRKGFVLCIQKIKQKKDGKKQCDSFLVMSKKQVENIIDKNPNMKDKYKNLNDFIEKTCKS